MTTKFKIQSRPPIATIRKKLNDAQKKLKDLTGAHKKISIVLDKWVQNNIRTEGGKVGGWPPFASGKGRWIRGSGWDTNAKLLQHTGRLRISFVPFHTRRNVGIGSDLPYSDPQNEMRQIIPEDDDRDVLNEATEIYNQHVMGAFKDVQR